jgi:hypothetical protein
MTTIGTTSRPAYVYDADTDTWVPIGVGPHTHDEYVDKVLFDNKGDILVGTGEDTLGKLAVGEDGQFLVVDLDEPTGLTWRSLNANIDVSATAPSGPTSGSVWFNSSEGIAYIYYDSYWVPLSPSQAGPQGDAGVFVSATAPLNTDVIWVDTDEDPDVPVPAGGSAGQILQKTSNNDYQTAWVNPPSGNAIINGAFDFWQRGSSFSNPAQAAYISDRWRQFSGSSGATRIFTRETFTPGAAPLAGLESQSFLRVSQTVAGTGDTFNQIHQPVEDVRTFAGQTVTISFYAKAASAMTVTPNFEQLFGSGGSSTVSTFTSGVSLTTSWQRFSRTVSIPSISGKTIGEGSRLGVVFSLPNNSTFTFDIWGVQLEAGAVATPFRRNAPSIQAELAACQRYYIRNAHTSATPESNYGFFGTRSGAATTIGLIHLPVEMRAAPTIVLSGIQAKFFAGNGIGITNTVTFNASNRQVASFEVNRSSGTWSVETVTLINGSTGSFIDFSAEL